VPTLNRVAVCVLLAATTACAGRAPSSEGREERPAHRERDVITSDELSDPALRALSVMDVVQLLRPHFLNDRGSHSIPYSGAGGSDAEKARGAAVDPGTGKVHVSIDNGKILPLEELRGIHANGVIEIRYLNPAAAMQKFGGAALEGPVILVRTM